MAQPTTTGTAPGHTREAREARRTKEGVRARVRRTRRKIPFARYTFRILLLILLFAVLAVLLLSALLKFGSPHIGRYQTEIQGVVSDYLGRPVELGEMKFDWGPLNPASP